MIDLGSQHATINVSPAAEIFEEWLEQDRLMEQVKGGGLHTVPPEYAELFEPNGNSRHDGDIHQGSENR